MSNDPLFSFVADCRTRAEELARSLRILEEECCLSLVEVQAGDEWVNVPPDHPARRSIFFAAATKDDSPCGSAWGHDGSAYQWRRRKPLT